MRPLFGWSSHVWCVVNGAMLGVLAGAATSELWMTLPTMVACTVGIAAYGDACALEAVDREQAGGQR